MKLYDYPGAPNPRRVKIFAREKGIELELIHCDMAKGEHKSPEFLKKNPSGKIPVLELEDGRCIAESVAICRYLEAIKPEPNLFGRDAFELGFIEAKNRQIELELWTQIGTSWVNGPIVGRMGRFEQIPDAKKVSDRNVKRYYERLDHELSEVQFVAGDRFSIADISLLSAIDFATEMVELKPDETLTHLYRWHTEVSARPGAQV
ncbi:MAG: glutathione S-transferase family protein [Pseudomonadales bacterium]|jgi:glutathione S-transferase|nr:glutathione S-transferase [Gammaproteobacteria bacterium]MDP6028117.1 glutathione S-transferase family protein [Pseudomonadales bacterium]MDP6315216.1 glutathione S-transferase family protein [Pseudomonadales bacterium]MDP7314477.1 glutathione S-transferase family protein [Pseudomonadales bacterium]|tara:strand:+ start:5324 stop:5938 length:615 start_codon:yes stop_codon:yes gene_type:complete